MEGIMALALALLMAVPAVERMVTGTFTVDATLLYPELTSFQFGQARGL